MFKTEDNQIVVTFRDEEIKNKIGDLLKKELRANEIIHSSKIIGSKVLSKTMSSVSNN